MNVYTHYLLVIHTVQCIVPEHYELVLQLKVNSSHSRQSKQSDCPKTIISHLARSSKIKTYLRMDSNSRLN